MRSKTLVRLVALAAFGGIVSGAMAATSLSTGFESADGFTTGGLSGQQGWSVSGGGTTANVTVSTADPDTGLQHIRMVGIPAQQDPNDDPSNDTGLTSPQLNIAGTTPTTTSFRLAIKGVDPTDPNNPGANYDIVLASFGSTNLLTADIELGFDGTIFISDGVNVNDTGAKWTAGAYHTFSFTVNANATPANQRIIYSMDGSEFAHSDLLTNGGTSVNRLQFFSDNYQLATETADIDNFSMAALVPEPATLGLLMTGAMLLRRRRHV